MMVVPFLPQLPSLIQGRERDPHCLEQVFKRNCFLTNPPRTNLETQFLQQCMLGRSCLFCHLWHLASPVLSFSRRHLPTVSPVVCTSRHFKNEYEDVKRTSRMVTCWRLQKICNRETPLRAAPGTSSHISPRGGSRADLLLEGVTELHI